MFGSYGVRRRRRHRPIEDIYPKVPSEMGAELMASGKFGSNPYYIDRERGRRTRFATKMMWRELGVGSHGSQLRAIRSIPQVISPSNSQKLYAPGNNSFQGLIPSSVPDKILHFDSRCYSGQFSDDGNFFFSCAQDFKVRMYDTSNPFDWKYYKTVDCPFGQWTITDASLSPDNRFLACSSISNVVCLTSTDPASDANPQVLDLAKIRGVGSPIPNSFSHGGTSLFGVSGVLSCPIYSRTTDSLDT